jgi:hypothetical protein
MTRKFTEIFTLRPLNGVVKDGTTFASTVEAEFKDILSTLKDGPGAIVMECRQDVADSEALLFMASWESLADHDYLDVEGVTTKLLKRLMGLCVSQDVLYLYLDPAQVGVAANSLGVHVFYVREGENSSFQKEIDARPELLVGAWHTVLPVPPPPKVMPTDPVERAIIDGQAASAQKKLRQFTPPIWVTFPTTATEVSVENFRDAVKPYVQVEKSSRYKSFLAG